MSSSSIDKKVITYIPSRTEYLKLLKLNPGLIIVKFGASWCQPCRLIKHVVDAFFATSPKNVVCVELDVDECIDLYAFLKSKRMINGIPAIFCYKKHNTNYAPDDCITGADPANLHAFFKRCGKYIGDIEKVKHAMPFIKPVDMTTSHTW